LPAGSFLTWSRPRKPITSAALRRTSASWDETRPGLSQAEKQVLAGLVGGDHHEVFQRGEVGELVRDLEGAQQPAVIEVVGGEPRDVVARQQDAPPEGGKTPATMLNSVVLPAPLGPIRPVIEPSSTDIEQSSTASRLPNRLDTFRTSMIGAMTRRPPGFPALTLFLPFSLSRQGNTSDGGSWCRQARRPSPASGKLHRAPARAVIPTGLKRHRPR
jgi:hypothetical protein